MHERAIDLLANAAIQSINYVLDLCVIGQCDAYQVPLHVVIGGCRMGPDGFCQQLAVSGVGEIGGRLGAGPCGLQQAVLIVVSVGDRRA